MRLYPKIDGPTSGPLGKQMIAFYKYDGSNLRFEWDRRKRKKKKEGWCKFGTRTQLFDESHPVFGEAIPVFFETYAEDLEKIFLDKYRDIKKITAFAEFFGPNSFAGWHDPKDAKELMLFDIHLDKKGFLPPGEFVKNFGHLKSAQIVYSGNLNKEFIQSVRDNKFNLFEGVVCKGGNRPAQIWRCKIKTSEYLKTLKERFSKDWEKHWDNA